MSDRLVPYGLGQTATSGELTNLLGYEAKFNDVSTTAVNGIKPLASGMTVKAKWVKNNSGGTLAKNMAVIWKTAYVGTYVDTVAGAKGTVAGFVDPHLTTTVADGDHFWLIVEGPTNVVTDGSEAVASLDRLICGGSGKLEKYDAAGAADEAQAICAIAIESPAQVDGTVFRALVNCK